MAKFILGYANAMLDATDNGENLTVYPNEETADYEAEEWVVVEADTLEEARIKYEVAFANWQKENGLYHGK